jgi:hypothetical protein
MRPGIVLLLLVGSLAAAEMSPRLVGEGTVGRGRGRLDDVAWAVDGGSCYAVGRDDGDGSGPVFGAPGGMPWDRGVVLRIAADGSTILGQAGFAAGSALPTSVAVGADGAVYVAGYGGPALAAVIAAGNGLLPEASFAHLAWPAAVPPEQHTDPLVLPSERGGGVPFVLRLSADLTRIEAATWLEGWQSVWHVPDPLSEDLWQPVGIQVLPGGDLAVVHDGGFQRPPGPHGVHPLDYYDAPDHLSRLAPDLRTRRWRIAIATPRTDPALVDQHRANGRHFASTPPLVWDRPWLGQTRSLRLRALGEDLLVAGVSPTRTAAEPWWSVLRQLETVSSDN